jgi:hypothetical protein
MRRNAAKVAWYAAKSHVDSFVFIESASEMAGTAGNNAELLNASMNCARENTPIKASFRYLLRVGPDGGLEVGIPVSSASGKWGFG